MLYHEIFSLFESINLLLMEGFKDDMYNLYPEAKNDDKFNNAINIFNSNENKIKDAVKKEIKAAGIEIKGNIASAIKNKCSDAASFVTLIKTLSEKLKKEKTESTEKRKKLEQNKSHQLRTKISNEYGLIRAGKLDVSPTDYWIIPCHTFEEAHDYSIRFAGNLPRLSKEEISKEYGIDTPESANYYHTKESPTEFLEWMKNEDRFFIAPTWCVAANNHYFDDTYHLQTKPDEKAKCYIIISKKYPNVRFCITLEGSTATLKNDIVYQKAKIKELRDPWQIGGSETESVGEEMMNAAFGEDGTKKIKQKVLDMGYKKLSELTDCKSMFFNSTNIDEMKKPMINLKDGSSMFQQCASLKNFEPDMPALVKGERMFFGCNNLRNFSNINLKSLKNGEHMFGFCERLDSFHVDKMPLLENSLCMFFNTGLKFFDTDMPKLIKSVGMFSYCKHLSAFAASTPSLKDGVNMFSGCENLYNFNRRFIIIRKCMGYV